MQGGPNKKQDTLPSILINPFGVEYLEAIRFNSKGIKCPFFADHSVYKGASNPTCPSCHFCNSVIFIDIRT